MGSLAARGVPAYASGGDWKMARGVRLSPVKGVEEGRAEAQWRLRALSGASVQGRRVWGVSGCCGRGESKGEAADGGAHRHGALGGGEEEAVRNRAVRASARKRKPLGLGF
jgi:hypothetical protein